MATIFTYGSLMCADIMSRVSGMPVSGEVASLDGFRRFAVADEDYPGIVACAGRRVEGQLYAGLSEAALRRLDTFEGTYYLRMPVQIKDVNGRRRNAETYVIRPQYQHLLTDRDWDFDHFVRHDKARFMASYVGYERL